MNYKKKVPTSISTAVLLGGLVFSVILHVVWVIEKEALDGEYISAVRFEMDVNSQQRKSAEPD